MKIILFLILAASLFAETTFTGGPALDETIEGAITAGQIPGGVVLVGQDGRIVYEKAYGHRALVPRPEPMTLDTVFDVASLTKVVATTSAIMKLVEEGKVRLNDLVTTHLPEFQGGKSDITIQQLLTHYSGMRPDVDLVPAWTGHETGIKMALADRPIASPNSRFIYSDINFLLLGEIVDRVSGHPLPEYVRDRIFLPLGMKETTYQPPAAWMPRIAPTEQLPDAALPLRGIVHDPTTRFMGGVAGHAGVFSTAGDLAKFAEMMLNMGERGGTRIFSPLTVERFTSPSAPPGATDIRGLGWDMDSRFSSNRGDLFPRGSYGHTGFTGTSMWLDPSSKSYVIFLSNSVHPKIRPAIVALRGRVANAAAAGLQLDRIEAVGQMPARTPATPVRDAKVLTGIDVLVRDNFTALKGKRVGLITNHTGITRDGRRNIDAMVAGGVNLVALYSPEHGIAGTEDHEKVGNTKDRATGIPVWSLYSGPNRRPTDEMLRGVDVLVFDIQDVGARFYTYICTMANSMEEAAKRNIPFVVLDRPNPITGQHVEGPVLNPDLKSFIGCFVMPVRHGMTVGELALMMNNEMQPKAKLEVIRMENWRRSDWFDSTGLTWIDPSPNMRSLNAATLYPGIGMLEGSKVYSVGRGTDAPFEQVGADWIRGETLASYLNNRLIPGIRVYPTRFTPNSSNFAGKPIDGIRFVVTDRDIFRPTRFGLELGAAIAKLFPGKMTWNANERLLGSREILKALEAGEDPRQIEAREGAAIQSFVDKRQRFLLY